MAEPLVIENPAGLVSFVGKRLGASEWVRVDQQRIDRFADATGDHQWIHVDAERASRDSPFGGTIAHGYLTLALAPALIPQILRVEGVAMAVNYGLEQMRLPAPVPTGARVRLAVELKQAREIRGGAVRATFGLRFELEGGAKPACVADAIYLYYPRA